MFAVASGRAIARFHVDQNGSPTELRSLALHDEADQIAAIDPQLGDGIVAVAIEGSGDHEVTIETFRESGSTRARQPPGAATDLDRRGTAWLLRGDRVVALHDGLRVADFAVDPGSHDLHASHDGAFVVIVEHDTLVAIDARGRERWRQSVDPRWSYTLTNDDKRVLVDTSGGLLVLDASTGAELARGCGWSLGLHDTPAVTHDPHCDDDGRASVRADAR